MGSNFLGGLPNATLYAEGSKVMITGKVLNQNLNAVVQQTVMQCLLSLLAT